MATTRYEELDRLRDDLTARATRLRTELGQVDKELQAVTTTIEVLNRPKIGPATSEQANDTAADGEYSQYLRSFNGMTQIQALVKIAKESPTNSFRLIDARNTLVAAKLVKSKKNATNILFNAIARSEKFKRIAPGEYELLQKPTVATFTSQTENLKRVSSGG
jgi:hypothetical protein